MKISNVYRALCIIPVLAGLLGCQTVTQEEADPAATGWPQWRGPNRDGKSLDTGLLKAWPEGGPKQAWKVDGLGAGYSTVSIGGGLIYTTGLVELTPGDKKTSRLFLTAVDLDGELKWHKDLCEAFIGSYRGARATPTYDNGNLYLQSGKGLLGCYDAKTGETKWTKDKGVRREARELGLRRVHTDPWRSGDRFARWRKGVHGRP
jgi:outer membrane protein assembly factor BamB